MGLLNFGSSRTMGARLLSMVGSGGLPSKLPARLWPGRAATRALSEFEAGLNGSRMKGQVPFWTESEDCVP